MTHCEENGPTEIQGREMLLKGLRGRFLWSARVKIRTKGSELGSDKCTSMGRIHGGDSEINSRKITGEYSGEITSRWQTQTRQVMRWEAAVIGKAALGN